MLPLAESSRFPLKEMTFLKCQKNGVLLLKNYSTNYSYVL